MNQKHSAKIPSLDLKKFNTWPIPNLVNKMCKYQVDPASIFYDTERTRFRPQIDGLTSWNQ